MKKIKFLLQHIDGIWSVPLGFLLFFFCGVVLSSVFGYDTGTYDVAFIQPLFLAAVIVIGATNAAVIGIWFTLRGIHKYLYGAENIEGSIVNYSKKDWLKVAPAHRLLIALTVLFFFITSIVIVYLKLV